MGIEILGGVLLLAAVATIAMLRRAKTVTTALLSAAAPERPPTLMTSQVNDPLGAGVSDRALFDAWALKFENSLFLDGSLVKSGASPAVHFVTKPDGHIVLS